MAISTESVKVARDSGTLLVQGQEVVKVKIEGGELHVEWLKEDWAQWQELKQSPEFSSLIKAAEERLEQSRAKTSKGAGKCK